MQFKQFAKKSKLLTIAYTMYNNWQARRRLRAGTIETSSGAIHIRMSLSENVAYIRQVFEDYIRHAGIPLGRLHGQRILEIGPGDNFGVALQFLAAGAKQVVCVDRFLPTQNSEREYALYQAVREGLPSDAKQNFDAAINLKDRIKIHPEKLVPIHGMGLEEADKRLEAGSFDLVVSRSVMEHLYNPDQALAVIDRLLAPGGAMIHKIDFRDHGMFTDSGFQPLTFLSIPESVYQLMTSDSGRPNRRLLGYYQQKMAEFGYDSHTLITHCVGSEGEMCSYKETLELGVNYSEITIDLLNAIRPKLRGRFRDMSDKELMVSGIFLIARKPAQSLMKTRSVKSLKRESGILS